MLEIDTQLGGESSLDTQLGGESSLDTQLGGGSSARGGLLLDVAVSNSEVDQRNKCMIWTLARDLARREDRA